MLFKSFSKREGCGKNLCVSPGCGSVLLPRAHTGLLSWISISSVSRPPNTFLLPTWKQRQPGQTMRGHTAFRLPPSQGLGWTHFWAQGSEHVREIPRAWVKEASSLGRGTFPQSENPAHCRQHPMPAELHGVNLRPKTLTSESGAHSLPGCFFLYI